LLKGILSLVYQIWCERLLNKISFKKPLPSNRGLVVQPSLDAHPTSQTEGRNVTYTMYQHHEILNRDPIERLIREAYLCDASDIHIEPWEQDRYRVRVRVNGQLKEWEKGERFDQSVVPRVKLLARMDIAERRLPQDGSFRVELPGGESVDVRVSSLPTIHGEKLALRLLHNRTRSLDELGFDERQRRQFLSWIESRHGMVLVTGPTGSGKTTTLYAALLHRRDANLNLSTLENPVEVKLPGVNQVEIQARTGLTFAHALRSVLRQDPDVLMIGEIRDLESAEVAARAALTGHLVLTSLHSDSAVGALMRLLELGVLPQVLATALRGVVGQRLVETRDGTRRAVFELLPITDSIRQGLLNRVDAAELIQRARRDGARLMPDVLSELLDRGVIGDDVYDRLLGERIQG
jgi:type II secretory ATPase GspE/PulE/Tfp pilus assembly ATPase PilB-like protein